MIASANKPNEPIKDEAKNPKENANTFVYKGGDLNLESILKKVQKKASTKKSLGNFLNPVVNNHESPVESPRESINFDDKSVLTERKEFLEKQNKLSEIQKEIEKLSARDLRPNPTTNKPFPIQSKFVEDYKVEKDINIGKGEAVFDYKDTSNFSSNKNTIPSFAAQQKFEHAKREFVEKKAENVLESYDLPLSHYSMIPSPGRLTTEEVMEEHIGENMDLSLSNLKESDVVLNDIKSKDELTDSNNEEDIKEIEEDFEMQDYLRNLKSTNPANIVTGGDISTFRAEASANIDENQVTGRSEVVMNMDAHINQETNRMLLMESVVRASIQDNNYLTCESVIMQSKKSFREDFVPNEEIKESGPSNFITINRSPKNMVAFKQADSKDRDEAAQYNQQMTFKGPDKAPSFNDSLKNTYIKEIEDKKVFKDSLELENNSFGPQIQQKPIRAFNNNPANNHNFQPSNEQLYAVNKAERACPHPNNISDIVNYDSNFESNTILSFDRKLKNKLPIDSPEVKIEKPEEQFIVRKIGYQRGLNSPGVISKNPRSPSQELRDLLAQTKQKPKEQTPVKAFYNLDDFLISSPKLDFRLKEEAKIPSIPQSQPVQEFEKIDSKEQTQKNDMIKHKEEFLNAQKKLIETKQERKKKEIEKLIAVAKQKEQEIHKRHSAARAIQQAFRRSIKRYAIATCIERINNMKRIQFYFRQLADRKRKRMVYLLKEALKSAQGVVVDERHQLFVKYQEMCAIFMQKIWRGYYARTRLVEKAKIEKMMCEKIEGLVMGWKVRRIINTYRMRKLATHVADIYKIIDEMKNDRANQNTPNMVRQLVKEVTSRKRDFFNAFEVLYYSGTWPQLERWNPNNTSHHTSKTKKNIIKQVSPQKDDNIDIVRTPGPSIKKNSSQHFSEMFDTSINDENVDDNYKPINELRKSPKKPALKNRKVREEKAEKNKNVKKVEIDSQDEVIEILDEMNDNEFRRPVVSYGNDEIPIGGRKKSIQNYSEYPDDHIEHATQNNESKSKPRKTTFLKRRNVYDPKKAIQEASSKTTKEDYREVRKSFKDRMAEESAPSKRSERLTHNAETNDERELNEDSVEDNHSDDEKQGDKSPKSFLKRKSKAVEIHKINWGKIPRRIDCWNAPKKASKTKEPKIITRAKAAPKKRAEEEPEKVPQNRSRQQSKNPAGRSKTPNVKPQTTTKNAQNAPKQKSYHASNNATQQHIPSSQMLEPEVATELRSTRNTSLTLEELEGVFSQLHNPEIDYIAKSFIEDPESSIARMTKDSLFFACYTDNIYETILEDLREHYISLCNS